LIVQNDYIADSDVGRPSGQVVWREAILDEQVPIDSVGAEKLVGNSSGRNEQREPAHNGAGPVK
jgi:hypothetical protein